MPEFTVDHLRRAVLCRPPRHIPGASKMRHAAVAMVFHRPKGSLELLMIQRAVKDGDPWSGHMALPGGHVEAGESPREAAVRETEEELGLDLNRDATFVGSLSQNLARAHGKVIPLVVTPFLFCADAEMRPIGNYEVAEVVSVPLSYLADSARRGSFKYTLKGVSMSLPCIDYEGHRIWGLTLRMLDELVDRLGRVQATS